MSEDEVYMEDFSVTFSQDADCTQNDGEVQTIEFHLEDNGVGRFIWFKTDRWSISESEDIYRLAERVRAMEAANDKIENN